MRGLKRYKERQQFFFDIYIGKIKRGKGYNATSGAETESTGIVVGTQYNQSALCDHFSLFLFLLFTFIQKYIKWDFCLNNHQNERQNDE